jgi:hypothetical protein
LPGAFYRAPGKDFAEYKPGTRQRKVAVTAPAPSAFGLPGALPEAPGKDFFNFFQILFAECPAGEAALSPMMAARGQPSMMKRTEKWWPC